jgi:hypothetical protein
MSSVDAEVIAHAVELDDLEQGLDMVDVLGLKRGLVPDVAQAVVPATQSVSTDEATRSARGAALDVQNLRGVHINRVKDLSKASDSQRVEGLDVCGGHGCRIVFWETSRASELSEI